MLKTLTELCQEIRNWFELKKNIGDFDISNHTISFHDNQHSFTLQEGQYFRIVGSVFNDGVYQYSANGIEDLKDENTFHGGVWEMAVPVEIIDLSKQIDDWIAKYGNVDSNALSPFTSESFGGYSYMKGSAGSRGSDDNSGGGVSWKNTFADALNRYRKI